LGSIESGSRDDEVWLTTPHFLRNLVSQGDSNWYWATIKFSFNKISEWTGGIVGFRYGSWVYVQASNLLAYLSQATETILLATRMITHQTVTTRSRTIAKVFMVIMIWDRIHDLPVYRIESKLCASILSSLPTITIFNCSQGHENP